jgi:hypothetical protein
MAKEFVLGGTCVGQGCPIFQKDSFYTPKQTNLGDFLSPSTHIRLLFPPFSSVLVKFRQTNGCRASF